MGKPRAGMTIQEIRFAALIAQGATQADAYRAVKRGINSMEPSTVWSAASTFAARPLVRERIKALLSEARLQDIVGVQEWLVGTVHLRDKAESAGNWNAVQALNRQIGLSNGGLQDKMQLVGPDKSDDALINELAPDNPEMQAQLRALIGQDSFTKPH